MSRPTTAIESLIAIIAATAGARVIGVCPRVIFFAPTNMLDATRVYVLPLVEFSSHNIRLALSRNITSRESRSAE
jgi:hypothetical protein